MDVAIMSGNNCTDHRLVGVAIINQRVIKHGVDIVEYKGGVALIVPFVTCPHTPLHTCTQPIL